MAKFNVRQEKFIQNKLEGMSSTEAYIAAGYKCKSRTVARRAASQLLTNIDISEELEKRRAVRRERRQDKLDAIADEALEMLPIMIKLGTKDEAPRVAAINLALKYAGLEPPKKIEQSGELKVKAELIPDNELLEIIRVTARASAEATQEADTST